MGLFDNLQSDLIKQARSNHAAVDSDLRKQQAEEARRAYAAYLEQRPHDVSKALSRRICTGDAGLPFLIIDVVFAVASTGTERGESADVNGAIESAKEQLWKNGQHEYEMLSNGKVLGNGRQGLQEFDSLNHFKAHWM